MTSSNFLLQELSELLQTAIIQTFPQLEQENFNVEITPSTNDQFGHYQCNSAMKLTKLLQKNPREIASLIVEKIKERSLFSEVSIAGPGFINMTLSSAYLSERLQRIILDPRLGIPIPLKKEKVIVEFSSPNIAKEMHVGHLRSTIIGECLARLFEFLGHDVLCLSHVGDWGTAFGMLIAYMKKEVPEVLLGSKEADLPTLMHWYRSSKKCFDEEEEFKKEARRQVVLLQGGEAEAIHAWKMICEISRKGFQEVYDLLDVHLIERGESFYNPMLASIVADLEKKGLITVSEGAKCVFHEGYEIPLMVQKSDGGYNYDTTDVAAMVHRIENEKADRIIIVTDSGQKLHFDLIYATCVKAAYIDSTKVRFDHVTFGVVLGPDGKKFKTRSGETEKLIDLLNAAISKAEELLIARESPMSKEECTQLAKVLGIDAVKYADLSCNRAHDYMFSYERMLRFEGNTAAFILYSYVRVAGIERKVGSFDIQKLANETTLILEHPSEIQLGLHLLQFPDIINTISLDLFPNHLTDYLYLLAQKFNLFFRDCRVEGSESQSSRLLLIDIVKRTLERGLHLLGLKTVDRM